ncbi:MAG TPA: succinate dehydrogenase iron-sulfur subunit [Myxococcales bacterium]|nr:succinate dehydrogenase iron-sulfur subunit [Myxococcales bacterium]
MAEQIRLRVKRGVTGQQHWEEFAVPQHQGANVISCLMHVQRNPVTTDGKKTSPVVWDSNCLEEVCGACTMVINGRVRQACSALVAKLEQPIALEPMTKFPLVRDLAVDRQKMFEALKRVHAWIPLDGTYDLGAGPRVDPDVQQERYVLSTCMTCGCCLEACPQVNEHSAFIGAAAISQVRLFNLHPTGQLHAAERLRGLMGDGGVADCNKDQNCVRVCPKHIPLTSSLSEMSRSTLVQSLKDMVLSDHGEETHDDPHYR